MGGAKEIDYNTIVIILVMNSSSKYLENFVVAS